MEDKLFEACRKGDTATLLKLIEEDPLILEDSIGHASKETPLHLASLLGHTDFVRLILNQKPEFAKVVNRKGYSPMHLACANGHVELVEHLLKIDLDTGHELCRRRDNKGRTPLHLATIKGRVLVAGELLMACPESVMEVTEQKETILHLTVKNENGFKALRILVEKLNSKELLNWKDEEGNTILHLAAARKQHKVMKYLLSQSSLDMNAVNSKGLRALDIMLAGSRQSNDQEVVEKLSVAARLAKDDEKPLSKQPTHVQDNVIDMDSMVPTQKDPVESMSTAKSDDQDWLKEMRKGIMVMAVLISTVSFDVAINPPGGVWQDGVSVSNITKGIYSQRPGHSIMGEILPSSFIWFLVWDSIAFLASMSIIVALTSPSRLIGTTIRWGYVRLMMWVVIASVHMVFLYGVHMIIDWNVYSRAVILPFVFFYAVVGLFGLSTGWSMIIEWRNMAYEHWMKKNR
ncbi:hypothetical protein FNV43_RR15807 [Rhamnella rubrinervis]|uniref:PGG domain-containing protein n=1 Tax=Rhamnella rubrinervis TaxID=2594499 RepID=A0A8K0ED73_9ROSA|nr:hypothetical protein FNV43_RR15807 [Rhamnella rubrinervis]